MKVLLFSLNTSRVHTNLAIRCLGASLQRAGIEATLLERTEKDNRADTLAALYHENADVYGFSTYIWNVEGHLKLAENLKKLRPDCKIVFGGPEVSYHEKDWLDKHPYIDALIRGEGEEAIVAYCRGQADGPILDGGLYKEFLVAPVPYQTGDYEKSILYYESSRGCPFACAYCLSSRHTHPAVRAKSAEHTLADMLEFEAMQGVKVIKFVDRTFNYDKKRALAIWKGLLDDRYTKHYHFEIGASLLDDECLSLLAQFPKGKLQLEIGVQSTNPTVLAAINRHDAVALTLDRLEKLAAMGNMHIHADLIAGLPQEDYASFARSFDDLFGKCHMLQLGFLKLLHGTPLEQEAEAYHYRFTAEPPYEVLENNTLSFAELTRLRHIEAVLERFSNSGRFTRAMAVLVHNRSPFAVFEALAEAIPAPARLSQREAYAALFSFEKSLCTHPTLSDSSPAARLASLKDALTLDFLLNEQGHLPPALSLSPTALSREEKQAFIRTNPDAFLPAIEVYDLPTRGRVYVDRKNKILYGE